MTTKAAVDYSVPGMLHQILSSEDYALALTPGFYRFYAHIGVLQALEERGCLRPSHVSGSSAGALVGGFLAAGKLVVHDALPGLYSKDSILFIGFFQECRPRR
jgi:hypothetical protein